MPRYQKNARVATNATLTYSDRVIPTGSQGVIEDVFELEGDCFYTMRFDNDMFDRLVDEPRLDPAP